MKTQEAIKWIFDIWHQWENIYGVDADAVMASGKEMDEVIELLKQGEKYEKKYKEAVDYPKARKKGKHNADSIVLPTDGCDDYYIIGEED